MKRQRVPPPPRHTFHFKLEGNDGKFKTFSIAVKVYRAKKRVQLTLTAADVEKSMQLDGVGNTQTCSMAICGVRHKDAFPHDVEGFIDWQYRSAFVVSKIGKDGLPSQCYAYQHSSKIAHLNDTEGGQKKLLDDLKKNGDKIITLLPIKYRTNLTPNRQSGSGERKPRAHSLKGQAARFATAFLGAAPPQA
jgi:hypothetical protein